MYIVSVQKNGQQFPLAIGAYHTKREDAQQLANGLSAGIGRDGIDQASLAKNTVAGMMVPDGIMVSCTVQGLQTYWVDHRRSEWEPTVRGTDLQFGPWAETPEQGGAPCVGCRH